MKSSIQKDGVEKPYKVGLVLSGGASRGFAHAGALKAMEELGVKPDFIAGTSAGAIAGALYAAGKNPEEIYQLFKSLKLFSFPRFRLGKKEKEIEPGEEDEKLHAQNEKGKQKRNGLIVEGSLFLNTKLLQKLLEQELAGYTFEQLNIPLIINATNLNSGKIVYFSKGSLVQPILASACMPFIFGHVDIDGHEYVDGGVMQNLPVRPIRSACRYIIAVHVNPIEDFSNGKQKQNSIERIYKLLIRGNTVRDRELADVLIEPQGLVRYGLFDIKEAPRIFKVGYEATHNALIDFIKVHPDIANANVQQLTAKQVLVN